MQTDRPPIIVSIATIPSRINSIEPTLASLLAGRLSPDLILVCTPRYCELEQSGYELPDFLLDQSRFGNKVRHVLSDADWGPGTKILAPLPHLPARDSVLIIADDDVIYHEQFVESLAQAQFRAKDTSFSFYVYRTHGLTVGQGCDGLSVWSPNLSGIQAFAERHVVGTSLLYHDDIWIAFFLACNGVKIKDLPVPPSADLVYKQVLPNNVLAAQSGSLRREVILATHLPRLLREADMPVSVWLRLRATGALDWLSNTGRRAARKAMRIGKAAAPKPHLPE